MEKRQPAQGQLAKDQIAKDQIIGSIRQFNPSATDAFLSQFDAPALAQYLERLEDAQRRAPKITSWVRPVRPDYRMVS